MEWIEEEEGEEEEGRRHRSAEDGSSLGDESPLLSLSSPCRYVEDTYMVVTTAIQCLDVLPSIIDNDEESLLTIDDQDNEFHERFCSYLEGN